MDGTVMYDLNLKGPIGVVIGNEGEGVGQTGEGKMRHGGIHSHEGGY